MQIAQHSQNIGQQLARVLVKGSNMKFYIELFVLVCSNADY